jgi:hypothetical protein
MNAFRRTLSLLSVVAWLDAGTALGHDFWIQPSRFEVAVGAEVELALRVGHGTEVDPVPWRAQHAERCFASDGVAPPSTTPPHRRSTASASRCCAIPRSPKRSRSTSIEQPVE